MKRTIPVLIGLVGLMFAASFFATRIQPPALAGAKSFSTDTQSGYRVERVEIDAQTCVVIVSKGNAFSTAPCR